MREMPCSYDGLDPDHLDNPHHPSDIPHQINHSGLGEFEKPTYIAPSLPNTMTTYEDRNNSYSWNDSQQPQGYDSQQTQGHDSRQPQGYDSPQQQGYDSPQQGYDSRLDNSSFNNQLNSTNLLDSCMKELEGRGNMNASDNDYMPNNSFRGPMNNSLANNHRHGDLSGTRSPQNMMNGGPYGKGDNSPYSSHMSVHSSQSNQPWDPHGLKKHGYNHDNGPSPVISHDNYAHHPPHRVDTPTRDPYSMSPRGDYQPSDRGTPSLPYYNHQPDPSGYRQSPGPLNIRADNNRSSPYPDDPRYHNDSYDNRYPDNQPASPHRSLEPEPRFDPYETRPTYMEDSYRPSPQPTGDRDSHDDPYFNTSHVLPQLDNDPFRDDPFHQQQPSMMPISMEMPQQEVDDDQYPQTGQERQGYDLDDISLHESYPQQPLPQQPLPPHLQHQQSYPDDSYHGSYHDDYSQRGDDAEGSRLRNPDLQEVIEYLSNDNDEVKANAAAYLTHLSYMDNDMKAKIRSMNGVRALVALLGNEFPEVCRNACCALKNLSYGQANSENKLAIRNENGISHLVRVLRKTDDPEVVDLVTAILWNMSSLKEVKMAIIDDALTMLVALVLVKYAGWERHKERPSADYTTIRWTTALRNTTGILRNLSSGDYHARRRLRECEALVVCVVHLVRISLDQHTENTDPNAIDNKCVENCTCVMRNLSYLCQESDDPDFQTRRPASVVVKPQSPAKNMRTGCFGGKKRDSGKLNRTDDSTHSQRMTRVPRDMSLLWHSSIVPLYRKLLMDSSNSVTLEAAVGAIQNVAACYWQASIDFRESVRREKCLPIIVELLAVDSEPVVCAAITALRNLTVNERNLELIGKYAMSALVSKLPLQPSRTLPRDHVLQATLTTLLEVIKKNSNYAVSVLNERGVDRLRFITDSSFIYLEKTILLAKKMLETMWSITELQSQYKTLALREEHFTVSRIHPRAPNQPMPNQLTPQISSGDTPYGTMSRPYSGRGYDDHTLTPAQPVAQRGTPYEGHQPAFIGYTNPAHNPQPEVYSYGSPDRRPRDEGAHEMTTYTTVDHQRARPAAPLGGIALFPPQYQSDVDIREPVYAKVNKNKGHNRSYDDQVHDLSHLRLDDENVVTNADSWV